MLRTVYGNSTGDISYRTLPTGLTGYRRVIMHLALNYCMYESGFYDSVGLYGSFYVEMAHHSW